MDHKEHLLDYVIRQADNCLILGQRLGEWCGHGPVLEQDIAITNIALDLIGQSRSLYQYAAEVQGKGNSEDDLAYLRDAWDFRNFLLVEQPNRDFAYTIARQFFYDTFHVLYNESMISSDDSQLVAIAQKSIKEAQYHVKWSGDWMLRLGDGTEESHNRIQAAVEDYWCYTGEMFVPNDTDKVMVESNIAPSLESLRLQWMERIEEVFNEAHITKPDDQWMQQGGKEGRHTEHLGYILADLQYLQRAYPGAKW